MGTRPIPARNLQPNRLEASLNWCKKRKCDRCIYIIQSGEFVKIGITDDDNMTKRLQMLQIGNPVKLKMLAYLPMLDPAGTEKALHLAFARYHVRGEWFKLPASILADLVDGYIRPYIQ